MLRFMPWSPTVGGDRTMAQEIKSRIAGIQSPSQESPSVQPAVKRKRSIGHNANSSQAPTTKPFASETFKDSASPENFTILPPSPARTNSEAGQDSLYSEQTPEMDQATSDAKLSPTQIQSLKQTIQTQIGLEILMKHNELRLIDQELAKCQIALEQLRRCTEIPFPVTRMSDHVSRGTGPSIRRKVSGRLPTSPAPWGVTDGPYTRHYAKWLLPDPQFDGGEQRPMSAAQVGQHSEFARATRGYHVDVSNIAGRSRSNKSKVLPASPAIPKDKSGPLVLKRKSDGKMVKLKCLDCARDDFGSAQGFINHCRIQHHRSFASHDAAAEACGEVVELGPTGTVVGSEPSTTVVSGAVHPLIRSAKLIKPGPIVTSFSTDRSSSMSSTSALSQPVVQETPMPSPGFSSSFQPSPLAPNLSSFIRNKGLGLDVLNLVSEAKAPPQLVDSEDESDAMDIDTPMVEPFRGKHPQVAGSKQPVRSAVSPNVSNIKEGGKSASFGQPPPHIRGGGLFGPSRSPALGISTDSSDDLDMEPSPTNDSNQAPSLVDDDEDEYEGHSPASTSESSDDEDNEVDFRIADDEIAGSSSLTSQTEYSDHTKQQLARAERRPSAFRRGIDRREEKHVSFVSPSPARDMAEHDHKRRKVRESD